MDSNMSKSYEFIPTLYLGGRTYVQVHDHPYLFAQTANIGNLLSLYGSTMHGLIQCCTINGLNLE